MMTVTILVPVYGVEKYIAECAESLFQQTYKDIEYVFCDDCTPDRSIEVLKSVMEKYPERKEHVRIISNDKNTGLGGTRVHLISEIKTDYFTIVDSDDVLPLDAIDLLVQKMQETDTDIVEGGFCFYKNGRRAGLTLPSHDRSNEYLRKVQVCDLIRHQVWGRLYKTAVLNKLPDMFIDGIDMAEDYCASTRLAAITTRSWTDEVVYLYRVEEQSFFAKGMSEKNIRSYLNAIRVVRDFYQQRGALPLPVEIGILRAYRQSCIEKGMTPEMVDNIVQYRPEHLMAKLLLQTLKAEGVPYKIKAFVYKTVRSCAVYIV